MKILVLSITLLFSIFSQAANLNLKENLSADFAIRSTYVNYGQRFSDSAVLEGSLTYTYPMGAYYGIWAASYSVSDEATNEVNPFIGYTYSINDNWSLDTSYTVFVIMQDSNANSDELNLSLSYDFLTASYSFFRKYIGVDKDGSAHYLKLSAEHEYENTISIAAHVAYTSIEKRIAIGFSSYADYLLGIYKNMEGFKAGLEFTNTIGRKDYDSSTTEPDGTKLDDATLAFVLSKSF